MIRLKNSNQSMEQIEQYGRDVLDGKITAGRLVKKAIERHYRDLEGLKGYYFDPVEGMRHVEFFTLLRHYKGRQFAGKTFSLAPWQAWIVYVFFGWMSESGLRRFDTMYVEVAKKQGKTSLMAGLALDHLLMGDEAAPEIYCCAKARHQSRIALDETRGIAQHSPDIRRHLKIGQHGITNPKNGGKMLALSSDHSSLDGLNPSMLIFDETHSYNSWDMFDTLTSGSVARMSAITAMITTAGANRMGPGYQYRDLVIKVLEGMVKQENLFGIIYTLDEGDDWKDPEVWEKSMPSLGLTVQKEAIKKRVEAAKNDASQVNGTLTKTFNIWVSAVNSWLSDDDWMKCDMGKVPDEVLRDAPCYVGLDLAYRSDLNALALLFDIGDRFVLRCHFWATETEIKRHEDVFDFWQWVNDGYMKIHPGDIIDSVALAKDMAQILNLYKVQRIGFDPALFDQVYQQLLTLGISEKLFDKVIQGTLSFTPAVQLFEITVKQQKVNHEGNPVLRWNVANTVLFQDSKGLIKLIKEFRENKIDGTVAAAMAFEAMRREGLAEPEEVSPYENPNFKLKTISRL
jgi:phage terminase large subunit-like protein